ncbi:MAG: hypothetical protein GY813_12805 [Halieaceae bacterium]|nr:hypothetical protein [Halieaceae bacterium]
MKPTDGNKRSRGSSVNTETELPDDVIARINAHREVSASERARIRPGVDLKAAGALVESCEQSKSLSMTEHSADESSSSIGRTIFLTIGVGLIYGIYRFIT